MGLLEDILKALDRVDAWRDLQAVPARMTALEQRIQELEKRLERCPAEGCPFCGALAWRLDRNDMNGLRDVYKCGECGQQKEIRHDLMKRPLSRGGTFGR